MARRNLASEMPQDEGSYILSVSDMMSGLLFIFIITLIFFVMKYKSINKSLASRDQIRTEILHAIDDQIELQGIKKNLDIHVDKKNGVINLRDKNDQMFFRSGEDEPEANGKMIIEGLASILADILPCYTSDISGCAMEHVPPEEQRTLEAVFIEGHTDVDPIRAGFRFADNWVLSVHRAISTYRIIKDRQPILENLRNNAGEKIFSVSGYGSTRRLSSDESDRSKALDRRIAFRFIMSPPVINADGQSIGENFMPR